MHEGTRLKIGGLFLFNVHPNANFCILPGRASATLLSRPFLELVGLAHLSINFSNFMDSMCTMGCYDVTAKEVEVSRMAKT
jgi:hypothetical protein